EAITCGAIVLAYLLLNAGLVDWHGGWAMGPRYLIPAIPFLAAGAMGLLLAWPAGPGPRRVAASTLGPAAMVAMGLMPLGTAGGPKAPRYDGSTRDRTYAARSGTATYSVWSPRRTRTRAGLPLDLPRAAWTSEDERTGVPLISSSTSPTRMPASAAGPEGSTPVTSRPESPFWRAR